VKLAIDRRILEDIGIKKWPIPSISRGSGRHRNPPGEKLKAQPQRTAGDFSFSSFWDLTIQFQVLSTLVTMRNSIWHSYINDFELRYWTIPMATLCGTQLFKSTSGDQEQPWPQGARKKYSRREQYIKIPNKSHLNPMINGIIYQ
jgi:hypothetical protein